jgi:hypothetical protein
MPDRILDLTSGVTMVVSDLHGDKDAFARYMGRFLQLRSRSTFRRLLLLGDLIHREEAKEPDESLPILLDVIRVQKSLPPGSVVMLLGNHEMPHLYGVTLARGTVEYTPGFEQALTKTGKREEVLNFLNDLPFYVRTAAGVTFTHAGLHSNAIANLEKLSHFDHRAILAEFDQVIAENPHPDQLRALYAKTMGMPYEVLARYYLAVTGPNDPRFDHLVRSVMLGQRSEDFDLLWDALFTRCEYETPQPLYKRAVVIGLEAMSAGAPAPQQFLVTGHIGVQGGHFVVTENHLRIASATHANPREAGQYLMVDFGQPVPSMAALEQRLESVF